MWGCSQDCIQGLQGTGWGYNGMKENGNYYLYTSLICGFLSYRFGA